MDSKTQQIIYTLDAIEASVRLQLKMLGAIKLLMAPDTDQPFRTAEAENQGFVATFEPLGAKTNPPCFYCHTENIHCSSCESFKECDKFRCYNCPVSQVCGDDIV